MSDPLPCRRPEACADCDGACSAAPAVPALPPGAPADPIERQRLWLALGQPKVSEKHRQLFEADAAAVVAALGAAQAEAVTLRAELEKVRAEADRRATELLEANNREVERRRAAERRASCSFSANDAMIHTLFALQRKVHRRDDALRGALNLFREYATHHRVKTPPDTAKAERNDAAATMCLAALNDELVAAGQGAQ